MKMIPLFLGGLSLSSGLFFLPFMKTDALAQCVVTDVAVQVAVHGSRRPARQVNDVDIESDEPCTGNTSTSTSTQLHVGGTDDVVQERTARHRIRSRRTNDYGIEGRTVAVPIEVQINVDNAADRVVY